MSSIIFTSKTGEARVGGRERAWCQQLVARVHGAAIGLDGFKICYGQEVVASAFGRGPTARIDGILLRADFMPVKIDGEPWPWEVTLNTALVIGGDALKFCARVHGQCEVHAFVRGPNRRWLATIIEHGLKTKVLREETQGYGNGWRDVVELLRASDAGPVVMSYSVCDEFPSIPRDWDDDQNGDTWYDLPDDERFDRAFIAIQEEANGIEMKPADWNDFFFGDGRNGFDMYRALERACLKRKEKKEAANG